MVAVFETQAKVKLSTVRTNVENMTARRETKAASPTELVGFALGECVVDLDTQSAKYLRAVHRTALELAIQNQFGAEIGGFWLLA